MLVIGAQRDFDLRRIYLCITSKIDGTVPFKRSNDVSRFRLAGEVDAILSISTALAGEACAGQDVKHGQLNRSKRDGPLHDWSYDTWCLEW